MPEKELMLHARTTSSSRYLECSQPLQLARKRTCAFSLSHFLRKQTCTEVGTNRPNPQASGQRHIYSTVTDEQQRAFTAHRKSQQSQGVSLNTQGHYSTTRNCPHLTGPLIKTLSFLQEDGLPKPRMLVGS